jgi:hypothetical protein
MRGVVPLGLHEVDVGIPEAGEDKAAFARDGRDVFGDAEVLAYCGDDAVFDQYGRVAGGGCGRRGVDGGVRDGEILRAGDTC